MSHIPWWKSDHQLRDERDKLRRHEYGGSFHQQEENHDREREIDDELRSRERREEEQRAEEAAEQRRQREAADRARWEREQRPELEEEGP